jgi:DNA-binding GntR family transcriptional regulator
MAAQSSPSPIPRVTLASMVGDRIRADVVEGALPPGSQLNEVELATTFGVSRGPVREALQRLIQEGLLLREPHRGVFVPVMTPEDVDDIYLVREAMETTAVRRLAGLSRTASASKALDRIVRAMETAERADDWNTVASRDLDFHSALVAAADSPRLERMFTTVISETRLCLGVLSAAYDTRDDLVEEHRRISDLIRQNDVDGAVAALKKHFDDGVVTLKRRLASRGGPQAG